MALGTSTNKNYIVGRVIIIILAAVFLIVGIVFQQLSFNTSSSASSSIQGKTKELQIILLQQGLQKQQKQ